MTELETLRPVLEAISGVRLRVPGMPMAVALQEAHDLLATLATGDTWSRLVAVGAEPGGLRGFGVAVAAARQAQSRWVVIRDRSQHGAQREREAAGRRLRTELLAACRFGLRGDAQVRAVLDEVTRGTGTADLVQDLLVLATLVDRHRPAFDGDQTFDAAQQAEAARSRATEISEGLSEARQPGDREAARLLRDQAFTHLATQVAALREAGRYAFRHEPERAAAFASEHRRGRARRRRRSVARGRSDGEAAAE